MPCYVRTVRGNSSLAALLTSVHATAAHAQPPIPEGERSFRAAEAAGEEQSIRETGSRRSTAVPAAALDTRSDEDLFRSIEVDRRSKLCFRHYP